MAFVEQTQKLIEMHEATIEEYEQKIADLTASHEEIVSIYEKLVDLSKLEHLIEKAAASDLSVEAWILNAIHEALYVPEGSYIKISSKAFQKLNALANARGQSIDDMTSRDGFTEMILTKLLDRSI